MEIRLKPNNLYRNATVVTDSTGDQTLVRSQISVEPSATNQYHIVSQFDRLDKLAYRYYKDVVEDSSKFWWVIADANNIENPLFLEPVVGKRIIIPDILKILLTI